MTAAANNNNSNNNNNNNNNNMTAKKSESVVQAAGGFTYSQHQVRNKLTLRNESVDESTLVGRSVGKVQVNK